MLRHQCRPTTPGPTTWLIQNEIICIPGSGNTGHLFNHSQPPHPHPHLPLPCSAVIPVVSPPCLPPPPPPLPPCCTVSSAPVVLAHSEYSSLSSGNVTEYSDSTPSLTTCRYSTQTTCPSSNLAEYSPVSADLHYGHERTLSVYTAAPTDVISEHFQRISSSSTPLAEYSHRTSEEHHVTYSNNTATGCGGDFATEHYQPRVTDRHNVGDYINSCGSNYQSAATSDNTPVYTTSSEHYQHSVTADCVGQYSTNCSEEYQPTFDYKSQLNAAAPEFQQQMSSHQILEAAAARSEEYQSTVTSGFVPDNTQTDRQSGDYYSQTVMTSEEYQQEQVTESSFIPQYSSPDQYQGHQQATPAYNASDPVTTYDTLTQQYQPQLNYAQDYIPSVGDYHHSPSVTSSYVTDYVTTDSAQYQSANFEPQYATQSEQYESQVTSSYVTGSVVEGHQPLAPTGHITDYNRTVEQCPVTSSYNLPDSVTNYATSTHQYQPQLNYAQEYIPSDYHHSPSVTSSYVTDYVTTDSAQYQSAVTTSDAAQSEYQYQFPVTSSYAAGSTGQPDPAGYITDYTASPEQCPVTSSYNASDCTVQFPHTLTTNRYNTEQFNNPTGQYSALCGEMRPVSNSSGYMTDLEQYHSTAYNASDDVTSVEAGTISYHSEYTPASEEYQQQYTTTSDFTSQSINYQQINSFHSNTEFTPASEEYQTPQQLEYDTSTAPVEYVFQSPTTTEYPGELGSAVVYHSYEDEYMTTVADHSPAAVADQFVEYPGDYGAESQLNYQDAGDVELQYTVTGQSEEYQAAVSGGYEFHEYSTDPQRDFVNPYSVTCPESHQDQTTSYTEYTTLTSEEYQPTMTTEPSHYYHEPVGEYLSTTTHEYLPDYVTEEYQPEMTSSYVPEEYTSKGYQMSGSAAEFVPAAARFEEYQTAEQTYSVANSVIANCTGGTPGYCPQTAQYSTEFNVALTEQNQTTNYINEYTTYSEEYQPTTSTNPDTVRHNINPLAAEFRPKNLVVSDYSPPASNDDYQPTIGNSSDNSSPVDYAASSDDFDPTSSSGYVSDNTPPYDDYLQSPASRYVVDYMAATEPHLDHSQVVADAVETDVITSQLADKLRLDDNNNKLSETTTVTTLSVTVNVSLINSPPIVDGGWSEWSNWIVEGWSNWMVCSDDPVTGEPLCGVSGRSVQPAVEKDSKHDLVPATVQHQHTEDNHDTTEELSPDSDDNNKVNVNRKTLVAPDRQLIVGVNVNLDTLKVSLELNLNRNMEVRTKGIKVKDDVSQVTKNYCPEVNVNTVTEPSPVQEVSSDTRVSLDTELPTDNKEGGLHTEVETGAMTGATSTYTEVETGAMTGDMTGNTSTYTEVDRVKA